MNQRIRRRTIVLLTALGALVTIAAVAVFQGNLLLRYYECRLRLEPAFLLEVISEPEESPAYVAASRFLEERGAREVLFRAYATHLAEEIDRREAPHQAFTHFGGERVWFDASYSGRKLQPGESFCDEHHLVPAIKRLLPRLEGEVFQLPGADGFEFSVLTNDRAVRIYRQSVPEIEIGSVFAYEGNDAYVCWVSKKGPGDEGQTEGTKGTRE